MIYCLLILAGAMAAWPAPPVKGGTVMGNAIFTANGAGRWYPEDRQELAMRVDGYLSGALVASETPLAVVSPHAGYDYSGVGSGYAYAVLKGKDIRRVIILGNSHYHAFQGISVLSGFDAYETPLGGAPIDRQAVKQLLTEPGFTYRAAAHKPEHSVENQIPFIQRALPKAAIVPCVVGFLVPEEMERTGETLRRLLDGHTVIAVSSDFTHYGQSFDYIPFVKDVRKNLEILDGGAIREIEACDGRKFLDYIDRTGATICGKNPVAVMLFALAGRARGRLLHYYTSSDQSGDYSHCVDYASIVMEPVK